MTQQNNETKQSQPVKNVQTKLGYLPTYEENVFKGGREGITKGKFHDMFMAGDGHELEDYVDEKGIFHLAHAKAIYSSSMLAYNFFHWVSPEHPFRWEEIEYDKWEEIEYDKVYFEVKFPIMTKPTEGRPVNRPANMDVVLISKDCDYMLCIESKYTEHTQPSKAEFADAYFDPSSYYAGNPYIDSFIKMAKHYNGKSDGYYAGIKQAVSHLIGLTNIRYDADALAWFKANNPFMEPEVMAKIGANTKIIFTNLLYYNIEMVDKIYDDKQSYPSLLRELLNEHLKPNFDMTDEFESNLLYNFIETYPNLYDHVWWCTCEEDWDSDKKSDKNFIELLHYLNDRYVLYPMPHFPLPDEYDSADQYLTDKVMEGAHKRYQGELSKEVMERIKSELEVIHYRHWADRFLVTMDYVRAVYEHGFCTAPVAFQLSGSVVCYALGITDLDPISAGLNANKLLYTPILLDTDIECSPAGHRFIDHYLDEKYYAEIHEECEEDEGKYSDYYFPLIESWFGEYILEYFVIDIVEKTIAATNDDIDFRTLPFDTPEQIHFFIADQKWREYTPFSETDMQQLRSLEKPTFEDVVRVFSKREPTNGFSREYAYPRVVLFLRLAWLKMHYPEQFQKAVNKTKEEWIKEAIVDAICTVKWLPENINRPYEEDLEDFNRRYKEDFNRRSKEAARMIKSTLKRLTALKGINRIYIKKIAGWHREGLVDLTNEQDLAKINIFLTKFLAAPICEFHNEHFTCKEKGTKMPFDEMPKLELMDAN